MVGGKKGELKGKVATEEREGGNGEVSGEMGNHTRRKQGWKRWGVGRGEGNDEEEGVADERGRDSGKREFK